MRILQICSARNIGGGETHLADLSNALERRGHQMFYALAPDSPLVDLLENRSPENILFARMRNALDVFSGREIAKFVARNDIEIIHAHVARDYPIAALAARISRKPFVLTRHVLFPLKRLQKYALRNVGGIITPSKAVADALRRQNLFPDQIIQTIHNGVDLKRFAPTEKQPSANFTVGTVGHLAPIKGHDIFIRAAAIVAEKRPDISFVIVGEDKSKTGENRRQIDRLIGELDLQNKINIENWTNDIRPLFSQFDLFVSAARREPFGLVIVEAMALRVPVIATRSEGATEIIENNASGVLVELENAEELAERILDLAANQTEREHLATGGRERVENYFSLEKMVAETEEFYQSVLSEQTAAH